MFYCIRRDNFDKGEKVIKLISCSDYNKKFVFFFSKRGMVKKTSLKEFEGSYIVQSSYKFKYDNDELISVELYSEDDVEMIIITKKGMAIKFLSNNINPMGKIAAGVTGISLREDDEAILGKLIFISSNGSYKNSEIALTSLDKVTLVTKNKEKKEVFIEDIKLQNRAGKGASVMTVLLEDEIKEIN